MKSPLHHVRHRRHRGVTAVLAMMYLCLFSVLAIGFYAATTTASQVVANDQRVSRAFCGAESGMDFMRYQLSRVTIPPGTAPDNVVNALYADLQLQLDATTNISGHSITKVGNTIYVPGGTNTISLDSSGESRFQATITDWAGEIVVKVQGYSGNVTTIGRAITMDFSRKQHAADVFDYAVASKGQVKITKGAVTAVAGVNASIATMMSAQVVAGSVTVSGGTVGGDLNVVDGATASVGGGSVGGSTNTADILANHVHTVDTPEFPTIDTTVYKQYATNVYSSSKSTQQNIKIPAGTNPKFNGGDTVQGIMYIESPNTVTFRGNFNLQGFIVFENSGDSAHNSLDFRGNVSQLPLPTSTTFDALRATTGISILAPTAAVTMSGSTDSFMKGSVIVDTFGFSGSADIQIDKGTLMTLNPGSNSAVFSGKTVKFTATGASNTPTTGVSYSQYYTPDPLSYQEVSP